MADVPDLFPLYERIVENTSEGVWVIDTANLTTFVNQSMADMLGYTREEMIGTSMFDLMDNEGRRIAAAKVVRRKQGISEAHEFKFLRKDGTPLWTRLATNPLYDTAGAYVGALALATDLTNERVHAAEGVRLWRILDESLNEIYIFRQEDLRFVYANRGALQNLGYTLEQIRDMTPLAIKPEHDHASFMSLLAPLVTGDKQRIEFQTLHRRRDGSEYPVDVHLQIVPDSEPRTFVAIINDISERLEAERVLRAREARFRSLIEHSSDLVALVGTDGSVKYLSPAFETLLAFSVESWLDRPMFGLIWPDDVPSAETLFAKSLQSPGEVMPWQLRLRHADGTPRWFEGTGTNLAADPNTRGIVINCRDITERRRAEEALRVKDQAIATALNGIAITDGDGRFIYANAAFVRLWGYASESEVLGKTPFDTGEPTAAQMVLDELRTHGAWQGEVVGRRKDGSTFDALLSANVVLDASGNLAYMMASALDISEARRLQAQLLQAQKMEAIGRLAGGVAHDFNNLLTVIMGHLELLLLDLNASDPLHRDLSEVQKAADSAATLTQQLLTFSRKQVIDPQILNVNDVVRRLRPMLMRLIGEDIDLQTMVAADLGLVRFDAGQSEQVLVNLAVNARDAMPDGGKLTIETANVRLDDEYVKKHDGVRAGDYVMLTVSDTGAGMSEDVRAHVFEPFFTTKSTGSGTGLGLAMIYGAVSQNGGLIEVSSEVGHGSTFKIYLPLVRDREAAPLTSASSQTHARGSETVLLVEDDDQVRALVSRMLARLGYLVRECRDGASAIRSIRDGDEFQLLVTDVVMPDMNGRVLAERIREMRPHIKVLFTSGYTANVIVHHGVLKEGVEFLQKPYSVESLAKRVRELLDKT